MGPRTPRDLEAVRAFDRPAEGGKLGLMDARRIKSLGGRMLLGVGAHGRALHQHAVVVLFHRVADGVPGSYLTCPPDLFRRFCAFFDSHFHVVSLHEILDRLAGGIDLSGCLAITFDDGYRDNHAIAGPILREMGLPATFFVTTGFIGSDRTAPWDAEREIASHWMSWDEVRGLRSDGFTIGAHTVNHPDLGRIGGDEAVREICESRAVLERELGSLVDLFAYPFGGKDRMTEANREIVRRAGYRCCVSAYGGVVGPGADPFTMKRSAVTEWHLSPEQWAFELLRHERAL